MIVDISFSSLALAAALLLFNVAISRVLDLGIEKKVGIAALRMVIQLTAVGFILDGLIATQNPWLATLVFLVMIGFAAYEVRSRPKMMVRGMRGWILSGAGLGFSAIVMTLFLLVIIIRPDPWWNMQYAVPLFGMLLGNAMTGVALTLDTFFTTIELSKGAVEGEIARGSTARAALLRPIRTAVRTGTMPAINSMAATGVVFLPGLMVGQILSGVSPLTAVKYQMLLMFLLAAGTALAVILSILQATWALTDRRQRLRLDRLFKR